MFDKLAGWISWWYNWDKKINTIWNIM